MTTKKGSWWPFRAFDTVNKGNAVYIQTKQLLGAIPETVLDEHVYFEAARASQRFDKEWPALHEDSRRCLTELYRWQRQALIDAAKLLLQTRLKPLDADFAAQDAVLLEAYRQRMSLLQPMREQIWALQADLKAAKEETDKLARRISQDLQTARDARLNVAHQRLAAFRSVADETGVTTFLGEESRTSELIREINHDHEAETTKLRQEYRNRHDGHEQVFAQKSSEIMQEMGGIQVEADRILNAAKQALVAAYQAKVAVVEGEVQAQLDAALSEIETVYKPFFDAQEAAQQAARTLSQQLTAGRKEGLLRFNAALSALLPGKTTDAPTTPSE